MYLRQLQLHQAHAFINLLQEGLELVICKVYLIKAQNPDVGGTDETQEDVLVDLVVLYPREVQGLQRLETRNGFGEVGKTLGVIYHHER